MAVLLVVLFDRLFYVAIVKLWLIENGNTADKITRTNEDTDNFLCHGVGGVIK
jgi:hypothetical protein